MSETRPTGRLTAVLVATALAAVAVALAGAGLLWLRYGTAVFFQTLAAGLAGCF